MTPNFEFLYLNFPYADDWGKDGECSVLVWLKSVLLKTIISEFKRDSKPIGSLHDKATNTIIGPWYNF